MTTGRINQVTISVCTRDPRVNSHSDQYSRRLATLSTAGVRYKASTIAFVNSLAITERIPK